MTHDRELLSVMGVFLICETKIYFPLRQGVMLTVSNSFPDKTKGVAAMKISAFSRQLEPYLSGMCCPKCGQPFSLTDAQLKCSGGHCYDLSSKGYVNLAPGHDQRREKYDATLFESRSRIFDGGFYLPLWNAIDRCIAQRFPGGDFVAADIGCGEGYYTHMLSHRYPDSICFGIDLSRDGIQRASKNRDACWLVGDLKHLPLADDSVDVLLDVLTPADYASFRRVLKADGILLKAVPGNDYLQEIRSLLKKQLRNPDYDNARVLDHLSSHGEILQQTTVCQTFPLTKQQSDDFLRMTPMTFSFTAQELEKLELSQITIHMEILMVSLNKG